MRLVSFRKLFCTLVYRRHRSGIFCVVNFSCLIFHVTVKFLIEKGAQINIQDERGVGI